MKIKIKKGRHYPWLIPIGLPICVSKKKTTIKKAKFMFTESCMFNLHDEDQWDVNKLFGFSIGHHHHGSSFRLGWRPILKRNVIEIVAYEYHNGVRQQTKKLRDVAYNKWYDFSVSYDPINKKTQYQVHIDNYSFDVELKKKGGLGYTLGVYFGGNEKAPHDIIIYKEKL